MKRRIVVGTDGSPAAAHALTWAAKEAARRDDELVIVHGWLSTGVMMDPTGSSYGPCETAGKEILDEAAALCRAAAPDLLVTTQMLATTGERALLQVANDDADLVVVGARGHGAVGAALLGSTADRVLHHARGAVAVVR